MIDNVTLRSKQKFFQKLFCYRLGLGDGSKLEIKLALQLGGIKE